MHPDIHINSQAYTCLELLRRLHNMGDVSGLDYWFGEYSTILDKTDVPEFHDRRTEVARALAQMQSFEDSNGPRSCLQLENSVVRLAVEQQVIFTADDLKRAANATYALQPLNSLPPELYVAGRDWVGEILAQSKQQSPETRQQSALQ